MTYCRLLIPTLTFILQTDVVKTVENVLKERNAYGATFYEIGEHSPIAGIKNGVKAFKDAGADVIVSVGGGSPVDASKAILYFYQQETGGPFLRQIAIPTTLSAAEYTVCSPGCCGRRWVIDIALYLDRGGVQRRSRQQGRSGLGRACASGHHPRRRVDPRYSRTALALHGFARSGPCSW